MRPYLEYIASLSDSSWVLFDRRLEKIPFEWHYNVEFELTLTLQSAGQRFIGDNISTYTHEDLVLMGPKIPHTWCSNPESHTGETHQAIVLWFSERFVESFIAPHVELRTAKELLQRAQRGLVFSTQTRLRASAIIQSMLKQTPGERLASLILLLLLLAADGQTEVLTSPRGQVTELEAAAEERVGRAVTYLHENYVNELSIPKLCTASALSRSSLHRLFKARIGMTISKYVTQLRVGHACALLMNSTKPISLIADVVGFNNLANFNRQFKLLKSETPRAFRNKFANQAT